MRMTPQHTIRQKGVALDASIKHFTFRGCRYWKDQRLSICTLVICYSTRCIDERAVLYVRMSTVGYLRAHALLKMLLLRSHPISEAC